MPSGSRAKRRKCGLERGGSSRVHSMVQARGDTRSSPVKFLEETAGFKPRPADHHIGHIGSIAMKGSASILFTVLCLFAGAAQAEIKTDRKSTRLNSSHPS